MNKAYLFTIRGTWTKARTRGKRIVANNYKNALNKILALHPGKVINSKFAINMDLISAKVEAAKKSKDEGETIYINATKDGEFELEYEKDDSTWTSYVGGKEVSVEEPTTIAASPAKPATVKATKTKQVDVKAVTEAPKALSKKDSSATIKNKNTMATATTKAATKVAAKKTAPAKKTAAPAKKTEPAKKAPANNVAGKQRTMTIKDLIASIKKGAKAFTPGGTAHSLSYLENVKDKSAERTVFIKD